MYNRFTTRLSPAQRAVVAPVQVSSEEAIVLSVSKAGLYQNSIGIPMFKLTVERSEEPGQPLELWGQASVAGPLSRAAAVGVVLSFNGTVQGSIGRGRKPHVVVNNFKVLSTPEVE